ncbi:GIY-YIG nuclease family protein [Caulobacter sp. DWR2-3-1b2]|uniref:GIY-YIG nuclease family protein n=1 Tax=unclassified Caulobacter TaxID=2648921 RepID=UPI003CED1460
MTDRRALLRDYKDRQVQAGIYAVRCLVTREAWIGSTPDLATRQSGVWFSLRMGGHSSASLQAAWKTHGEAAFGFDVLEVLEDEGLERLGRASLLVERREHWRVKLGAEGLRR